MDYNVKKDTCGLTNVESLYNGTPRDSKLSFIRVLFYNGIPL